MPVFRFEREQRLPRPLDEVFAFFADPANLELITPPWLRFRILGASTPTVCGGTRISYRLALHGIPIRWVSLISDWSPPRRFVDQQVRGPYRSWLHRHEFVAVEGGTLVRDRVEYEVLGGRIVDRWFVRPDLDRIFDHRSQRLVTLLGDPSTMNAAM